MNDSAKPNYLSMLGQRIWSEANDLKRTPKALASETGIPLETVHKLERWFVALGIGDVLRRYVTASFIESLSGNLISRARAVNNIRYIDGPTARQLALTAFNKLCPAESGYSTAK